MWLVQHLLGCTLSEEVEGYLLGRGARSSVIEDMGFKTWQALEEPHEDPDWLRYGPKGRGEWLVGWAVWPLVGPTGAVIGFAARNVRQKKFTRWLLPQAAWSPVFTGLTPKVMSRIWKGADIWLVEGVFDLFALQWAVEEGVVLATETAKLSNKQLDFLWRWSRGWTHVVYDNDEAGRRGTHGWTDEAGRTHWGAIRKLERVELRCSPVTYSGKDPGDIWSLHGRKGIQAAFPQAR